MYAGKIVEFGACQGDLQQSTASVHRRPAQIDSPLGRFGKGCAPAGVDSRRGSRSRRLPPGCAFQPRCKDDRGDTCGRAPIPLTTLPSKSPGALCEACLSVWISFSRSFLIGCFVMGLDGTEPSVLANSKLEEISRAVARLSELYTRERADLRHNLLQEPDLRLAYLAYFLPSNFLKINAILDGNLAAPKGEETAFRSACAFWIWAADLEPSCWAAWTSFRSSRTCRKGLNVSA